MSTTIQRSPITQPGGKYHSVKAILPQFPHQSTYKTYIEVFGGTGVLMLNKPPTEHLEVFNDANGDLINWWLHCRDTPKELEAQLASLPYSRALHERWHTSLYDGSEMSAMERAVRWYYVSRSSLASHIRKRGGNWGYDKEDRPKSVISFRSSPALFEQVADRFRRVQIEQSSYEHIIATYERPSAFFYCDPPYIGSEYVYEGLSFAESDHRRLAALLNATPALVALSYYPHSLVDELYPAHKWRRVSWSVFQTLQKKINLEPRPKAQELLLMNYPEQIESRSLWYE